MLSALPNYLQQSRIRRGSLHSLPNPQTIHTMWEVQENDLFLLSEIHC